MMTHRPTSGFQPASASGGRLAPGGFTLIELLVVCAIISILAAIAVPNFLDAQTRSKVSRMKNDMRTISLALESYYTDYSKYPIRRNVKWAQKKPYVPEVELRVQQMLVLTTPIAYVTSLPTDIFEMNVRPPNNIIEYFDATQTMWMINSAPRFLAYPKEKITEGDSAWLLISVGPDGFIGRKTANDFYGGVMPYNESLKNSLLRTYDPTNGIVSAGNIFGGQWGIDKAGMTVEQKSKIDKIGYDR